MRGSVFKVFPAQLTWDKQKVPIIHDWKKDASDDPEVLKKWSSYFGPKINFWGVPCGSVNNILVLDIDLKPDPKTNDNGWDSIRKNNYVIPDTLSQKTLSGGSHYIFKYPNDGNRYPNRVGFLPGLDIRSEGGWIAWYDKEVSNKPILEAPAWLLDQIKKSELPPIDGSQFKFSQPVAEAMLNASLDAIRNAPPQQSNNVLNTEAFKVGQLVAAGAFTREFAENQLFCAAIERGKPKYEAEATIESGLNGGVKNPLVSPFTTQPAINIPIPPQPEPVKRWTPNYLTRYDLLNTSKLRKPQLFENWSTEDIHITTADGGTGKTTLKLYEAICLALGDRFLGFENKQRGKTLFITGEDTDKKLAAMLGAIMKQMGLFDPLPGNEEKVQCILDSIVIKKDADLCLIAKDKQGFLYPNSQAMTNLLQAVEDIKPKMIVFDPIASFWGSESALNDMNKVVTKFMSWLSEISGACVEMINHMGKSSSANKDMSQFAGRGGSGLPSNSRVSRVLRPLTPEEFKDMTNLELTGDQSSILCNVNKFSDGSILFNKPFAIVRDGYLFRRVPLTMGKVKELEQKMSDIERVFEFVKLERHAGRWPTMPVVINHFKNNGNPIAKTNTEAAIATIQYQGYMGERFRQVANPDIGIGGKVFVLIDEEGKEL